MNRRGRLLNTLRRALLLAGAAAAWAAPLAADSLPSWPGRPASASSTLAVTPTAAGPARPTAPAAGGTALGAAEPGPTASSSTASSSPAAGLPAESPCAAPPERQAEAWPDLLPPEQDAARRLFLAGKCALERHEYAAAEAIFRQGIEQHKPLPNLWRYHQFRALMEAGRTFQALAALKALLQTRAVPDFTPLVRQSLAERAAADGGGAELFDYLATYQLYVAPEPEDYDLLERLLGLARQRGDTALQRKLPLLLWRQPKDEAAARQWSGRKAPDGRPFQPTDAEYLERARRLTELRLTRLLAAEVEAREAGAPQDPATARKLGRLYFAALLRDHAYRQAAAQIQSPAVRARFAFDEQESLEHAVRIELRRQSIGPARKSLTRLEALTPRPESLAGFYLDLARYYQQRGDLSALLQWCGRAIAEAPGSQIAASAYWLLVWNHFARGEFDIAQAWSEKAIAAGGAFGPETLARFHYWQARSQEQTGAAAASSTWAVLRERWPSSYYGLMAESSARAVPPTFAPPGYSPQEQPAPVLEAAWAVPELADALFAYAVGETAIAEAMVRNLLQHDLPDGALRELAALLYHEEQHHLQQRLIANHGPAEHLRRAVGDSSYWRQAYPAAFWDLVMDQAGSAAVSPYYVLAVMREESRFFARADSRAGAKGLMQLMPGTARELARGGRLPFAPESLLEPETNIPLGVRYLRAVLHRFDWNPIYAAAAYNAGPNAVLKWLRTRGHLPMDEFVESIPFEETQTYVKRVYTSYLIYRKLYR
jgi:soluble lytic murein transglycosylase